MLACAGAIAGEVLLFGGVQLRAGSGGGPERVVPYLEDAYRLDLATRSWTRCRDLPRPSAAAPSPAVPLGAERLALLGGDDGLGFGRDLRDAHPGFEGSVLYPGVAGGSNWGSVAYDAERKLLIANTSNMALTLQILTRERARAARAGKAYSSIAEMAGTPYAARSPCTSRSAGRWRCRHSCSIDAALLSSTLRPQWPQA